MKRFFHFLALTMLASAAVLVGFGLYSSGAPDAINVFWQSVVISMLVAAGAGWMSTHPSKSTQSIHLNGNRKSADVGADTSSREEQTPENPEEQSITVKLLELTALGDRYGNTFSVALVCVDHLKEIDENYDTAVTMRVLKEAYSALAHTLRMPDRVGEYDYGIYLVVLPETNLPGAVQIAERLRAAVSDLDVKVSGGHRIHTTVSVGVTCYRRGDDLRSLLDRAGMALREAESQGRNRVLSDLAA